MNVSRGSVYYESQPVSDADLKLMRRIGELHVERRSPTHACCMTSFEPKGSRWAART